MKRFLLAVLVVAALTLLALPGAVGWMAEQGHEQVVGRLQAAGHEFEAERYERGWFSSAAQHSLLVADPQWRELAQNVTGADGEVAMVIATRFDHGPVPGLGASGVSLAPAWTQAHSVAALRTRSGDRYALPGTLTSRVEPDGRTRFEYRAEAGQQHYGGELEAHWQPAAIDAELSRGAQRLAFSGTVEGVAITDRAGTVAVGRTELSADQRRIDSGLWIGTSDWRIASVDAPGVTVADVELATDVAQLEGAPAYRLTVRLGSLATERYAGEAIEADIELRDVDPAAVGELLELAALGRPLEVFDPAQRPLLQRLLATGPELTLHRVRVPTHDAAIVGTAALEVAPGTKLEQGWSDAVSGNADVVLPRALVDSVAAGGTDQLRAVIELMRAFRMLKLEGDSYRVRAQYAQGLLSVNGLPVPLPAF